MSDILKTKSFSYQKIHKSLKSKKSKETKNYNWIIKKFSTISNIISLLVRQNI